MRRTIHTTTCSTCRRIIWTGLDADVAAFTAHVDPTPLDPLAELVAILDGRRTYTLWPGRGRPGELYHRDPWFTDRTHGTVHAEHRCTDTMGT